MVNSRHSSRVRRRVTIALIAAAVFLAATYAAVSITAAYVLTKGTHRPLELTAAAVSANVEDVTFQSRVDHLQLRGWLAHSAARSGRSVILVHGRDSNRVAKDLGAVPLARDLLANGYDVLLFDLRASGESAGDRFTLGADEPRDVLGAYDFMRGHGYVPARMGIIGWSEGAVTVLEAAPQLNDVAALVADSAFAELRPVLDVQIAKNDPLPRIFDWGSITAAHILFGFDPDLRPVDAVRALPNRAFLFFHGASDETVPPANAAELRSASANPQSKVVIIQRAGHALGYKTAPDVYLATLHQFLDQQMSEHGG
jgi:pimeloyl-ACP methyl ester carboxylesterase